MMRPKQYTVLVTTFCWLHNTNEMLITKFDKHVLNNNMVITLKNFVKINRYQGTIFGSQEMLVESKGSHKEQEPSKQELSWLEVRRSKHYQCADSLDYYFF